MRKFLAWILLITLCAAALYQWQAHKELYRATGRAFRHGLFPCSSPVTYSIGVIDPRYDLSSAALAARVKEAEDAWESAAGRDLFKAAPEGGDFTINLVYDRRQAALDKLKVLGLKA